MKKISVIICTVLFLFSVTGCGVALSAAKVGYHAGKGIYNASSRGNNQNEGEKTESSSSYFDPADPSD
jgi:hypothetical protein